MMMLRFRTTLLACTLTLAACSGSDDTGLTGNGSGTPSTPGTSGTPSDPHGSTSGNDPSRLFAAPTGSATPDSVFGTWGGTKKDGGTTFDTRLKLAAASVESAVRCTSNGKSSTIVSVAAAARISDEQIDILESKEDHSDDGSVRCGVNLSPMSLTRCAAADEGFETNCFVLERMQLTIYGDSHFAALALTKLAD